MRSLEDILAISIARKGSVEAVLGDMAPPLDASDVRAVPNDRWLSAMSRGVFQAGFNWTVVDTMWPGFETAFHDFDPGWCAHIADDRFDQLIGNPAIVRHGPKIRAVAENAAFVQAMDPFGDWLAGFGVQGYAALLLALKSQGTRLGGTTGQYMLRTMGVDGWILSRDVSARLVAEGVVDKVTYSARGLNAIQDAFLTWHEQSGRSLKQISRILATSVG